MSPIKNMNSEYVLNRARIQNTQEVKPSQGRSNASLNAQKPSFESILDKIQSQDEVKFSKHAVKRLQDRNVELSQKDLNRLNDGVGKARNKGVKEALIMMDNKVFVASIKNNTIITAAVDDQLKENVFTNIDGAVIV